MVKQINIFINNNNINNNDDNIIIMHHIMVIIMKITYLQYTLETCDLSNNLYD